MEKGDESHRSAPRRRWTNRIGPTLRRAALGASSSAALNSALLTLRSPINLISVRESRPPLLVPGGAVTGRAVVFRIMSPTTQRTVRIGRTPARNSHVPGGRIGITKLRLSLRLKIVLCVPQTLIKPLIESHERVSGNRRMSMPLAVVEMRPTGTHQQIKIAETKGYQSENRKTLHAAFHGIAP